jgi:catechol 2,3-dioxygenase-like lactoylglutathione lyase family enzyme
MSITHVPIVVPDQDEALRWYQDRLGFVVCEDNAELVPDYRWLTVAPGADRSTRFILMLPQEEADVGRIGKNGMCVLACDDVEGDCQSLAGNGVRIVDGPNRAAWGTTAIIADLYGNPYYLVQPNAAA